MAKRLVSDAEHRRKSSVLSVPFFDFPVAGEVTTRSLTKGRRGLGGCSPNTPFFLEGKKEERVLLFLDHAAWRSQRY